VSRRLLNCWVVAMYLWLAGCARQYAWVRRSHAFRGTILHFGYAGTTGWRRLTVIEFIPPKGKLWSRDNVVLFFRGRYRVWHFYLTAVSSHNSLAQAMADRSWGKTRDRHL